MWHVNAKGFTRNLFCPADGGHQLPVAEVRQGGDGSEIGVGQGGVRQGQQGIRFALVQRVEQLVVCKNSDC